MRQLDEDFNKLMEEEGNVHKTVANCIAQLMHSATVMHMAHLGTKSYAIHMALNAYYTGLPALVDTVAEYYQGRYGVLLDFTGIEDKAYQSSWASDPVPHLQEIRSLVQSTKQAVQGDSAFNNEMDVITTLIASTIYKLKFLS